MSVTDHTSLINYLIAKYRYTSYLEIGCEHDVCFSKIQVAKRVGVDPNQGGTVRMTSDDYFDQLSPNVKFDLIFVDGLHHADQVDRDLTNSLAHLSEGGTIVIHDCKPESEEMASNPYRNSYAWTGDVWRAIALWRGRKDVDLAVGNFDWGCGVLRVRSNGDPWKLPEGVNYQDLPWSYFVEHSEKFLNLKTVQQLEEWVDKA